jgi:hypothetical protein
MAQHIPIQQFKQKRFRDIEKGIISTFKKTKGLLKTSTVYNFLETKEDTDIYYTTRRVPESIVYGGVVEIEIHYNKLTKNITSIYLVA